MILFLAKDFGRIQVLEHKAPAFCVLRGLSAQVPSAGEKRTEKFTLAPSNESRLLLQALFQFFS